MKQVVIDLDDVTMAQLERVAPSRERKRTEFIRNAIRRALDEAAQQRIADGYRRIPDDADGLYSLPEQWEIPATRKTRKVRR